MLKKFLIGTFAVATLFVGVSALTASAAPQAIVTVADIQYAATVKLGSSGQAALIWQNFLNGYSTTANLVADGKFGPLSEVQAKAWQTSKGLVGDGVMGKMSRAAAIAQITSGTPASAFPAGCTSTVGFSSVTGLSCAPVALPAGCTAGALFSATTGASCSGSVVVTLPAGCSSTAGFSSTTGASCSGSTNVSTGPLTGGAGDITITTTTTDVENGIVEGQNNTKVLGFKVQATDSDVSLTNLKLTLTHTGDGTSTLSKYITGASIWMNGTKVGTANVADFTKSGSEYSKSIALSNAVVRMGSSNRATFYVTVDGASTIDSLNQDGSLWNITVDNVRFQDATGVIMTSTDSATKNGVTVGTLADSGNVKLVLSKDSSSPTAGNVQVSDTSSTSGILMLAFKLKDTGTDMTFDTVNVNLTGNLDSASLENMLSELILKHGSSELASISDFSATSTVCTHSNSPTCTFQLDSPYTISADSTDTFSIYANISSTNNNANFSSGDSLTVDVPVYSTNSAVTGLNTEDVNGNPVSYSSSATGEEQFFYSAGISAANFTSGTPTVNTSSNTGSTLNASWPITFKVTAFGDDYYVAKTGTKLASTGTNASFADLSASSSATDEGDTWLISDGNTVTFTTTGVIAAADAVDPGFNKIVLNTLKYGTSSTAASDTTTYNFTPQTNFQTTSVYFNN